MNKNSLRQLIVTEMILADVNGGGHVPPKKRSLLEMMDDSYLSELEDGRLAHSMESVVNLFEEVPKDNWTVTDRKTGETRAPKTSDQRSPAQQAVIDADTAARAETKAKAKAAAAAAAAAANPAPDANSDPVEAPAKVSPENLAPDVDSAANEQLPAVQPDLAHAEIVDTSRAEAEIKDRINQDKKANATDTTLKDPASLQDDFDEDPDGEGAVSSGENDRGGQPDGVDSDGGGEQADPDPNSASNGLAFLDAQVQSDLDAAAANTEKSGNTQSAANESHLSLIDLLYDA